MSWLKRLFCMFVLSGAGNSSDLLNPFLEGRLPGVQLEDFYPVQNLVHDLDASILVFHVLNLVFAHS